MARKYMVYSSTQVANAVDLARNGYPIRRAAAQCNVPESTVRMKLRAKRASKNPGRPTVLTKEEETFIVSWIIDSAKVGFPVDGQRLKTSVAYLFKLSDRKSPFNDGIPGRKWLKLFLRRHPNISRRIPSALSKQRATVTETKIRVWFDHIQSYFDTSKLNHVAADPVRVFNMDESAIRLVPTREEVFAKTGAKYVHTNCANSEKEAYTTLFAANAAGSLATPLVLFPYKQRMPAEIARHAPSGWAVGKTQSGWMNQETFYYYLKNIFHPWLLKMKITLPVIVYVDGHTSHVSYQTTEFCRENGIELICLFPNATHILQPLDVAFFRPLKARWNKRLIEWRTHHAGESIAKHEFTPLLKKAVDDMENLKNTLTNGFRKCGLVPWDPNAVNYAMLPEVHNADPEAASNGTDNSSDPEDAQVALLSSLEDYLKVGQLKLFMEHQAAAVWPGPAEDTNLFYVWQQIKKNHVFRSSNETSSELVDAFQGFDEASLEGNIFYNALIQMIHFNYIIDERTADNRSFAALLDSIVNEKSLDENSLELPLEPTISASSSKSSRPAEDMNSREDFLEKAFTIPTVSRKSPKRAKSNRPRPPAVATSEEFREWYKEMEQNKENEEQKRQEKKAARETKRKKKTSNVKQRPKTKTQKPRL